MYFIILVENFISLFNIFVIYLYIAWGLIKKSLKQHAIWLFLKKKSLDLLPIKVKTKNQDQSPPRKKSQIPKKNIDTPLNAQHYIYIYIYYEIESLFFINFINYFFIYNYSITIVLF